MADKQGSIDDIGEEMPYSIGKISVNFKVKEGTLQAEINLPEKTLGEFGLEGESD